MFRDREPQLEIVEAGRPWSFDSDGRLFRLVSEAQRINLAHLFDPVLAIHTSEVDPLPHQITAVYGEMLPRQPLRFLLADDPGAGKTIMAGLLIKELLIRGDLHRCLVVCPGNLVEQWQDELFHRFQLPFEILTNDKLEAARTGNWFQENPLAICRLDKLSRNADVQAKLAATDWDLVICDEAHKLSATSFGGEVKYTRRYKLGQLLGSITRHFLLLTATPHNGKPEDFQLFLALLDSDRFEGKFRDGVHSVDASDLMRRLVKEQLLKFDGKPLFPDRLAYTVSYKLSDQEVALYKGVTDYVREEFNRADALENDGRKGTVGFALTILQRRLASSPEAIYRSLLRRRFSACRRVARTLYIGSAPTMDAAKKGIEDRRIKLGCFQPGETSATFGDALRKLYDQSTYLYQDGSRYWYSTQASVARLAQERAAALPMDQVVEAARQHLKEHEDKNKRGDFARVQACPASANEILDEPEARLVILGPEYLHTPKQESSSAQLQAVQILEKGGAGRNCGNMLVFLAADQPKWPDLEQAIRLELAWKSIMDDVDHRALNVDLAQADQAKEKLKAASQTVQIRLPECYQWLLVPGQQRPIAGEKFPSSVLSVGC